MSLVIDSVSKSFNGKHHSIRTLEEITLEIDAGEFLCILGPSGCGKSTLLNIIAGLEQASAGQIFLNGRKVRGPGRDRAVMFQEPALFPWLRVIDNVEFGMKMSGIPASLRRQRALYYLNMVHLTKFQHAFVHELSGGMKQRVAIARALTLDSEVLLMDEPFAALDRQTRSILQAELQRIWSETGKTIVFVTHDVEEAVLLADRVVVMAADPGRIKTEFKIHLARPRQHKETDFAYVVGKIMKELHLEVEGVAQAEYDGGWPRQKDKFLPDDDRNLGTGT